MKFNSSKAFEFIGKSTMLMLFCIGVVYSTGSWPTTPGEAGIPVEGRFWNFISKAFVDTTSSTDGTVYRATALKLPDGSTGAEVDSMGIVNFPNGARGVSPTQADDLATKDYVDANVNGNIWEIADRRLGATPGDLTIDASGNIYVLERTGNAVLKVSPSGVVSTFAGTVGQNPYDIVIDDTGNFYTADYSSDIITKITPLGSTTSFASTDSRPRHITRDLNNNLFTSNTLNNTITKITPAGVSTTFATLPTDNDPNELVTDSLGNLYVSIDKNSPYPSSCIIKVTPAGTISYLGNMPTTRCYSIAIDSDNNIYTVNSNDDYVYKITPGGVTTNIGTVPPYSNYIIRVDPDKNIYILSSLHNLVYKISSSGVQSIYGITGDAPRYMELDNLGNIYTVNVGDRTLTKIPVH